MTTTATYKCKCCSKPFTARVADRNRGWARFCSKSCKAIHQTQNQNRGKAPKTTSRKYHCQECGDDAKKYLGAGVIEYLCAHHAAMWEHPFSSDGLGQW